MKAKLIKVQDEYWLSTDRQTDLCYHLGHKEILKVTGVGEKSGEVHHEKGWSKPNEVVFIDRELSAKLSLKNCQAIERGYDLDELANEYNPVQKLDVEFIRAGFKAGFQKALEILGDRKFTEEDIRNAMSRVWDWCEDEKDVDCSSMTELRNKHIQSLQQNEWEVEVEMEPYHDGNFVDDGKTHSFEIKWRPELDADVCLMLKRC